MRVGSILMGVVVAGLLAASQAAAGGPTSLLIVNPASERTSSAHAGDARYERLARHVGIDTGAGVEQPTGGGTPPGGIDQGFGSELRLTWLVHDMSVWRVDRIHLGKDEVWINTTRAWGDDPHQEFWHRAAEPEKLRAALDETGVLRPASPRPTIAEPTPADSASGPVAGSVIVGTGPAAPLTGLGLGLLGLACGIGGTLLVRQVRQVRPVRRPRSERIVLKG